MREFGLNGPNYKINNVRNMTLSSEINCGHSIIKVG